MAIGSPPPPEKGVTSNLPNRTRNAWLGGALLIALVAAAGTFAWRDLRTSDTLPPHDATARDGRAADAAPHEPAVEDPSLSERLLAAAAVARREVVVSARVAGDARDLVRSLELVGGFERAPSARPDAAAARAANRSARRELRRDARRRAGRRGPRPRRAAAPRGRAARRPRHEPRR